VPADWTSVTVKAAPRSTTTICGPWRESASAREQQPMILGRDGAGNEVVHRNERRPCLDVSCLIEHLIWMLPDL
jgi:hypothetical protein